MLATCWSLMAFTPLSVSISKNTSSIAQQKRVVARGGHRLGAFLDGQQGELLHNAHLVHLERDLFA